MATAAPDMRAKRKKHGYVIDAVSLISSTSNSLPGIGKLPWALQAAAILLLVLALVNLVNLGVVRQLGRMHEFALRRALGARLGALIRLILKEHIPLLIAVGFTAMLLTWVAIGGLNASLLSYTYTNYLFYHLSFGLPIIIFIWLLTVISFLVITAAPSLMARTIRMLKTLNSGTDATGGRGVRLIRRIVGVAQISLTCALIITSGMFSANLWQSLNQQLGFSQENRLVASITLPTDTYMLGAWWNLKEHLKEFPNMENVAGANTFQYTRALPYLARVSVVASQKRRTSLVFLPEVSSIYFSTTGMQLLRGRSFTDSEVYNHAKVAVVNALFAREFFGSVYKAVGQNISIGPYRFSVIGVSRDIKRIFAPGAGNKQLAVYIPLGFAPFGGPLMVIAHFKSSPSSAIQSIRQAVHEALPGSVISSTVTVRELLNNASAYRIAGTVTVGLYALIALLVAALGAYSIIAFNSRSRTVEYSIRAALGASPDMLVKSALSEIFKQLIVGLPIGFACAYAVNRTITSQLLDAQVFNIWIYVTSAAIVVAIVILASWLPARQASKADFSRLFADA